MKIIKDFFKFNRKYSLLICFLSVVLGLLSFYLTKAIFDISSLAIKSDGKIIRFFILFVISLVMERVFKSLNYYILSKKATKEERIYFNKTYLASPLRLKESEKYQDKYNMLRDFLKNRKAYLMNLSDFIVALAFIFLSYFYVLTKSPYLFLIFLLTAISYIPLNIKASSKNKSIWPAYMANMRKADIFNKILIDKDHLYERKLFSYKDFIQDKFKASFKMARDSNKKLGQGKFIIDFSLSMVSILSTFCLILLLGFLYLDSNLIFSDLLLIFTLKLRTDRIYEERLAKIDLYAKYRKSLDLISTIKDTYGGDNMLKAKADFKIDFKNVYFSYPGSNEYIIKNFTYSFTSGKSYLLIGENGSGKSTLIKLLLGFYKPDKGSVKINGVDAHRLSSQDKRRVFSTLLQDSSKYPFTIRENIDLSLEAKGKYSKNIGEISKGFNDGLDSDLSKLSDNPVGLSGGQWQKVFIERVYNDKDKILVLDEPTASLDPISELEFYKTIDDFTASKLAIFISHRMGIVSISDRILVLKDNKLTEEGNFRQLMDKKGVFYDIYQSQKKLYE